MSDDAGRGDAEEVYGEDSSLPVSSSEAPSAERWRPSLAATPLFEGVFLGGFDCSSQRLADGRRLDMLATTRHDELVDEDYVRLRNVGMTACRDGVPWALVEREGRFDFTRFVPMVRAARRHEIDVIWDLTHFGWPDDVDPFLPTFPTRFGRYASAFARWLSTETDRPVLVTPVNEMSFVAWAGGEVRCLPPFEAARGVELKAQLVRATIEAIEAIRLVVPGARFVQPEPLLHIAPASERAASCSRAEVDNLLQFQAWEMLTGRVWPSLGGHPRYLDIVGVDFYAGNQFASDGTPLLRDDVRYRPFGRMLLDVWDRYQRPMIVSETGSEGSDRACWLRYVTGQCIAALRQGCELHGVTLYPIVDDPGWIEHRRPYKALWNDADAGGHREPDPELLAELLREAPRLEVARAAMLRERSLPERER